MTYKVKEVAEMVHVSVRLLHHYHKIGLLIPESVTPAGYRLYSQKNLEQLQQILFFRELDFTLNEIKEIMNRPHFDRLHTLESHKHLLKEKIKRLEKIVDTVEDTINVIKGDDQMDKNKMFDSFDMSEIEAHKAKYAKEVEEKYGGSDAYKECSKKTESYSKDDWSSIMTKMNSLFAQLAALMDRSPEDADVQSLIEEYRNHITNSFYNCTPEIFKGLGEMYVADKRFTKNIDAHGEGLSQFMREAINIYCSNL